MGRSHTPLLGKGIQRVFHDQRRLARSRDSGYAHRGPLTEWTADRRRFASVALRGGSTRRACHGEDLPGAGTIPDLHRDAARMCSLFSGGFFRPSPSALDLWHCWQWSRYSTSPACHGLRLSGERISAGVIFRRHVFPIGRKRMPGKSTSTSENDKSHPRRSGKVRPMGRYGSSHTALRSAKPVPDLGELIGKTDTVHPREAGAVQAKTRRKAEPRLREAAAIRAGARYSATYPGS